MRGSIPADRLVKRFESWDRVPNLERLFGIIASHRLGKRISVVCQPNGAAFTCFQHNPVGGCCYLRGLLELADRPFRGASGGKRDATLGQFLAGRLPAKIFTKLQAELSLVFQRDQAQRNACQGSRLDGLERLRCSTVTVEGEALFLVE